MWGKATAITDGSIGIWKCTEEAVRRNVRHETNMVIKHNSFDINTLRCHKNTDLFKTKQSIFPSSSMTLDKLAFLA